MLQWLCKVQPLSKEQDEALRKWMDKVGEVTRMKMYAVQDQGRGVWVMQCWLHVVRWLLC